MASTRQHRAVVRIVATDYACAVFGPALIGAVAETAPHVTIRFEQLTLDAIVNVTSMVARVDGVISPATAFDGAESFPLFSDEWVCLRVEWSERHPRPS